MAKKKSHGIRFGELCPEISRGIQLSKTQVEQCLSDEPTGYRYLTLADMNKSISPEIDVDSLAYFDPAPLGKSVEQFCLKNNMILLSKNDTPYKVDFIGDTGDEKIIVSGNIYMITVNEEKITPIILSLWLKTEAGMRTLNNSSSVTDNGMKWLSIKQLNEMLIPDLTPEEQSALLSEKIFEATAMMMSIKKQVEFLSKLLHTMFNAMPGLSDKHNNE